MTRIVNLIACLSLVATMVIHGMPSIASASQPQEMPFDLANVPLPAGALPEPGYQVLTGGFLDQGLTAHWIASPRNGDPAAVEGMLTETGWVESYTLDLVLLEDRAWAHSEILSLVQTNVYLFADDEGAEDAESVLADFSTTDDAEEAESAIQDASTIRLRSQGGDTWRSVTRYDRTIVEVVTLEAFGAADLDFHRLVIADTFDRLGELSSHPAPGLAARAALIGNSDDVADLFNAQQTGVHQIYRLRDGEFQLAAGEMEVEDPGSKAPGLSQLYTSGQVVSFGHGNGFYSSWIGEFRSEADAASFVASLPENATGALLLDPYFTSWAGEASQSQGVPGLYRVSGTNESGSFSGTLEIRQRGLYVVGVGWRTFGNVLPSVDVTSRLMDAQITCLESDLPCPSVYPGDLLPPESATPVAPSADVGDGIVSAEFGWSVNIDPQTWVVNERFAEPGYDFVEMQSGRSLVTLESVIDQHGNAQQCVLDEMRALQNLEEHAVIDLGSDDPGEAPAGLEERHGWAIYTVEPLAEERADQEYTIRFDCYTLVDGGASLIVTQRAPRGLWVTEREKGALLRANIVLPEGVVPDAMMVWQRPGAA